MNRTELEKEVKRLVHDYRYRKGYVCTIDVLMGLGYLTGKALEDWRFRRVSCIERVCSTNLNRLSFIIKTMRKNADELGLESSLTVYRKYGKGPKHILRFSKSGDKRIEELYATHYLDKNRIAELRKQKADKAASD
jgi:hypothetical protein